MDSFKEDLKMEPDMTPDMTIKKLGRFSAILLALFLLNFIFTACGQSNNKKAVRVVGKTYAPVAKATEDTTAQDAGTQNPTSTATNPGTSTATDSGASSATNPGASTVTASGTSTATNPATATQQTSDQPTVDPALLVQTPPYIHNLWTANFSLRSCEVQSVADENGQVAEAECLKPQVQTSQLKGKSFEAKSSSLVFKHKDGSKHELLLKIYDQEIEDVCGAISEDVSFFQMQIVLNGTEFYVDPREIVKFESLNEESRISVRSVQDGGVQESLNQSLRDFAPNLDIENIHFKHVADQKVEVLNETLNLKILVKNEADQTNFQFANLQTVVCPVSQE